MDSCTVEVGQFVRNQDTGRMGVVEQVSGDRSVVEVRMNGTEELVMVCDDEMVDWD